MSRCYGSLLIFLNSNIARTKTMLTEAKPTQFKFRTEVRLMTTPPNPDPSAKPNWMKEVFTLRAMSGFRGTSVTRYSCWAGQILQVDNIKIIKIKINTKRLTPARANKRRVAPCNRSPRQIVN